MRTAWVAIVSAALVLGGWTDPGHAFNLPREQDLIMNLIDASCLFKAGSCPEPGAQLTPQYAATSSDGSTSPLISAPGVITGDESRTVFNITAITPSGGGPSLFGQSATEEISGLLYDLRLATTFYSPQEIDQTSGIQAGEGIYTLNFTGAGRNPILGAAPMTGGVIEFYNDMAPVTTVVRNNAPSGPGPDAWLAGSGGHVVGAAPTGLPGGADSWAATGQATDDSLWLAGVLTALSCIDATGATVACSTPGAIPIVLKETLQFSPTEPDFNVVSTQGVAYIDVMGGSQAGAIQPASFGTGPGGTSRDMQFSFSSNPLFGNSSYSLGPSGDGNTWHLDSSDPIRVRTVPQPGSHVLLGLGLIIAFFALRRWGGIAPARAAV